MNYSGQSFRGVGQQIMSSYETTTGVGGQIKGLGLVSGTSSGLISNRLPNTTRASSNGRGFANGPYSLQNLKQ